MSYTYSVICTCTECRLTRMQNEIDELKKNDKIQVGHIQRLLDADGIRRNSIPQSAMDTTLTTLAKKWKSMENEDATEEEQDKLWDAFSLLSGLENGLEITKAIERYSSL